MGQQIFQIENFLNCTVLENSGFPEASRRNPCKYISPALLFPHNSQQAIVTSDRTRLIASEAPALSAKQVFASTSAQLQISTMSLIPFGNDPFFGGLEKALDRAFDRALGARGGDMSLFLPTLTGPSGAAGHPMVSYKTHCVCLFCNRYGQQRFHRDDFAARLALQSAVACYQPGTHSSSWQSVQTNLRNEIVSCMLQAAQFQLESDVCRTIWKQVH